MKKLFATLLAISAFFTLSFGEQLNVLVVTGGHSYDTPEFEQMCKSMEGVHCDFMQTEEMQGVSAKDLDKKYDALVLMDMVKAKIADEAKQQYMDLTKLGTGIVFLHFTLASRPYWDEYHEMIGGKYYLKPFTEEVSRRSTFLTNLSVDIEVIDKDHPTTKGISDFTITDAFYGNITISDTVKPILSSKNPKTSKLVAWENKYQNSKIIYFMPGFTKSAYANKGFKTFVHNAIGYVKK